MGRLLNISPYYKTKIDGFLDKLNLINECHKIFIKLNINPL